MRRLWETLGRFLLGHNESFVKRIPSARVRALRQARRSATSPRVHPQTLKLKGREVISIRFPRIIIEGVLITTCHLQGSRGNLFASRRRGPKHILASKATHGGDFQVPSHSHEEKYLYNIMVFPF